MPPPNESTAGPVLEMSNRSGAVNRAGSRFAAPSSAITRLSAGTGTLFDRGGCQAVIAAQQFGLRRMRDQGGGAICEQIDHRIHAGHEEEGERLQQLLLGQPAAIT